MLPKPPLSLHCSCFAQTPTSLHSTTPCHNPSHLTATVRYHRSSPISSTSLTGGLVVTARYISLVKHSPPRLQICGTYDGGGLARPSIDGFGWKMKMRVVMQLEMYLSSLPVWYLPALYVQLLRCIRVCLSLPFCNPDVFTFLASQRPSNVPPHLNNSNRI